MLTKLRALWHAEPVRITGIIVSLIVFIAAKAGLVVDQQSVGSAVAFVVPILLGSETARTKVKPHHSRSSFTATSSTAGKLQ